MPTYKIKIIKNNVNFNIVSLNAYKTPAGEHVCLCASVCQCHGVSVCVWMSLCVCRCDERNFVMADRRLGEICSFNLP